MGSTRQQAFVIVYPWAHAAGHAVSMAYQVLYLLGQIDFWSPVLHLLRLRLSRHFPEPPAPGPDSRWQDSQTKRLTVSMAPQSSPTTAVSAMTQTVLVACDDAL